MLKTRIERLEDKLKKDDNEFILVIDNVDQYGRVYTDEELKGAICLT